MELSTAMALLGVCGILIVVIATMLLPETAGSELRDLEDLDQEVPSVAAASDASAH